MKRATGAPVVVFSGPSGAGKTTLLEKLLPALIARGVTVGALKHSGHPHALDRPGKDSARLREAGAVAVAVQGPREVAYFGPPLAGVRALARMLPNVDLVLAEGFKGAAAPRIEVHRAEINRAFLCAEDPRVVAVVGEAEPPRALPWFKPDEVERLADFVMRFARRRRRARRRALASGRTRVHRVDQKADDPRGRRMARTKTSGRARTARSRAASRSGGATVREAGRKGGRRTLERRGPEFYSRIGRKGGKSSGGARRSAARKRTKK